MRGKAVFAWCLYLWPCACFCSSLEAQRRPCLKWASTKLPGHSRDNVRKCQGLLARVSFRGYLFLPQVVCISKNKCSIFNSIFKDLIFQRHLEALKILCGVKAYCSFLHGINLPLTLLLQTLMRVFYCSQPLLTMWIQIRSNCICLHFQVFLCRCREEALSSTVAGTSLYTRVSTRVATPNVKVWQYFFKRI